MMTIEPDRVDEIFCQAEQLSPAARSTFLDEICAGEPELRREVESLLISMDETGVDFLEQPLIESPESWTSPEGRRLGAFRILREIGRGGMSRVFLAVRDDQEVEQQVAVKILKWGIDTAEMVRRFRRERQILARLEHPNIARFLDGGTTEDGLPFVVMELVEGEPISRYCESQGLSIRQRLELFREVCAAVRFAHQKLVVHRDLKPGNILVTADGTPKLLDFGIAKLLHDDDTSLVVPTQSLLTKTGAHPMTLAYASPEQIHGDAVTTATDVYSLGVVLYQLLTGARPYGEPNHSALDLARAVCEREATKPSAVVGRNDEGRSRQKRLAGDLDSIVLKALEKEPERRYASVEEFSEDIKRHLDGLTVTAREPKLFYKLGRYLSRHRLEVISVLLVFLTILGFSINNLGMRDQAVRTRDSVSSFLDDFANELRSLDPEAAEVEMDPSASQLDQPVEKILAETALEPRVLAKLLDSMASAYMGLGRYDEAEPLMERTLELRRALDGIPLEEFASSLLDMADVHRRLDHFGKAERLVEEALVLLSRQRDSVDLARTLNNQAGLAKGQGDLRGAEKLYRSALEMKERLLGREHGDVATTLHNLAVTLRQLGEFREAADLHRESLVLRTQIYGEHSPDVARALDALAILLRDLGELEEAEVRSRQALDLRLEIYGDGHPRVATTFNNLATILQRRGRLDEAADYYDKALKIREERFEEGHSSVARVLRNQATLQLQRGDAELAEETLRRALDTFRGIESVRERTWRIADAESVLGACLLALDRHWEAEKLLLESYETLRKTRGEKAPRTLEALERLELLR